MSESSVLVGYPEMIDRPGTSGSKGWVEVLESERLTVVSGSVVRLEIPGSMFWTSVHDSIRDLVRRVPKVIVQTGV